jgi:hypothetical protein
LVISGEGDHITHFFALSFVLNVAVRPHKDVTVERQGLIILHEKYIMLTPTN